MSDTDEEIVSGPRKRGRKVRKGNGCNKNLISDDENTTNAASSSNIGIIRSEGDIDLGETSSEWESDWPSEIEEAQEISSTSHNITADSSTGKLGYASDSSSSSNEDTEKCPICLLRLSEQEIGSPDVCEHIFCAPCIDEWSKNVTTCPIDRKTFEAINIYDNINNKTFLRKEPVKQEKKCNKDEAAETEDDLTYCEICRCPNREETMLLCDGCNLGYHMECLNPPLTEIPEGEFFCDNCFQSSDEDLDDQEVNDLLNDLGELGGLMESRFRRRIHSQPRIPRTRQSERIRGEIMRRIATSVNSATAAREVEITPGPSRRSTGSNTTRTVRKRKKKRTRRRIIKKIISEYDVNNKDEKFAMKKKIIYKKLKRRSKRRRTTRRSSGRINRSSSNMPDNEADAISKRRVDAGVPTLSIMGNPNALDYFSDDDDDIGSGSVATQSVGQRFNQTNALRRRQAIKAGFESTQSNPLDLLDTIMESQERWHSKHGLKDVKIRGNGALVFNNNGTNIPVHKAANEKTPDNTNAGAGPSQENRPNERENQQKSSSEAEVSTSTNTGGEVASSSQTGGDGDGNEQTADYENKAEYDHDEPSEKKNEKRPSTDEEACPNFSIYSAETLDLVNASDDLKKNRLHEDEEFEEKDVDLVQLGDDEEEADEILQEIDQSQKDAEDNTEKENGEIVNELEENRSYTPCLDEIHQEKKDQNATESVTKLGIDGMETELISEDEIVLNEMESPNHSGAKKKDLFKKVSRKGRDRNYRDKERHNDRTRSSRYDDKENNHRFKNRGGGGHHRREKRKEIERYDVRTLIAEKRPRTYKDPFGRDVSPKAKSKSGSKSRSKSREMSISLSPEPRYRRDFRRRTISPRRSISRGRRFSRSPIFRRSISISKSRSRNRSRSRHRSRSRRHRSLSRSRSRSPSFDHKLKKTRRRRRSKSMSPRRSVSRRRSHSRLRSRSLSRNRIRRASPEKVRPKKKKNRGRSRSSSEKRVVKKRNKDGKRRSVSPIAARSRSRSRTRSPIERYSRAHKNSWTPPLHPSKTNGTAPNLTVILTNQEAVSKQNKKDKEKKKSGKESKRRRDRAADKNQTSKEVFTSGDNILVSVNFNNKDQNKENDKADDSLMEQPSSTSQKKQKGGSKKHREPEKPVTRRRRKKKLDAKPVVIIDLDRSPFKVITPSPKAVIVLSDSDHEKEKSTTTGRKPSTDREMPSSTRKSPSLVDMFGPKTPPHPQNCNATSSFPTSTSSNASKQQNQSAPKFSMQVKPTKPKVATVNLLYDPHDLALDKEQDEMADKSNDGGQNSNYNTIGPNTPPEPPPDVYDPFEPTKSPSNSPGSDRMADDDGIIDDGLSDDDHVNVASIGSNSKDGHDYGNEQIDSSMPDSSQNNISNGDEPSRNSGKITVLSNILINSKQPANNDSMFDEFAASSTSYSRITPVKSYSTGQSNQTSLISKLPMPPQPSQSFSGNTADSPYSPGASDFEDLFDQPNDNMYKSKKGGGGDFENLFGKSPVNAGGKKKGKSGHKKFGKGAKNSKAAADDDDINSSNMHLNTKDRFLKKLHRQERVVEEVKLVIKPYYNKKLISKEEYKDILRKAVPKICHSKTGEINPMKIQSLIKAYVRKIRHRHKSGTTTKKGNMNNTII